MQSLPGDTEYIANRRQEMNWRIRTDIDGPCEKCQHMDQTPESKSGENWWWCMHPAMGIRTLTDATCDGYCPIGCDCTQWRKGRLIRAAA